ncbi:hypothetical protein [Novosphingobium terrae]|uniref:hypothetical protein n=1 Tax=Novosphingobium terrae TaxID=2726189 RepID=UPI0019802FBB|nr:hypothetical protein [Novosphingobium terrae]
MPAIPRDDTYAADAMYAPILLAEPDGPGRNAVALFRNRDDGSQAIVWQQSCESQEGASALHEWMLLRSDLWNFWGRLAARLGADPAGMLILKAARADEEERQNQVREAEKHRLEEERLSRVITLYCYTPKGKRPYLGLERGNADEPFFKMSFAAEWECDRVVDWLQYQRKRFEEMAQLLADSGQLALERHILEGMRAAERDAKARGISVGGRRPLRFWRGQ